MEAEDKEPKKKCQLWKPNKAKVDALQSFSDVDLRVLISKNNVTEA